MQTPTEEKVKFLVRLRNDSYLGLDIEKKVSVLFK
jgi:hypothetical protein